MKTVHPFLALLFLASSPVFSRSFTIDDILTVRRPIAVQISPDGSEVAYLVAEPNDAEHSKSPTLISLWLVRVDDGQSRLLAKGNIHSLQWTRDGRSVSYVSRGQIQVLPANGGEPRQIRSHPKSISAFTWSPDGRRIAFTAEYTDPKPADLQHRLDIGFDAIDFDPAQSLPLRNPNRAWILDTETGRSEMLRTGARHILGVRWSPDGASLLLTTASKPVVDEEGLRPRLEVISISGGELHLYCATLGKISMPDWSPDGRSIAFLGSIVKDSAFYPEGLFVCQGPGSTSRNLNPASPYIIESFRWVGGGEQIIAMLAKGAHHFLASMSPADPKPVRITDPDYEIQDRSDYSTALSGARVAFILTRYDKPPDVWVHDRKFGDRQLTHLNPQLEGLDYGKGREVRWTARDGLSISGVLILPHGYLPGKRYPMIVALHGSSTGEANDYQVGVTEWGQFIASQGYVALIANYRGSLTDGPAFSRASKHDWGGKDMTDVLDGVAAMVKAGIANPHHLGISGTSYGGYLTARTITQDTRFKAAVIISGISNWFGLHTGQTKTPETVEKVEWIDSPWDIHDLLWDRSPSAHLQNVKTPLLALWGELDPAIEVSQAMELFRGLRHFGVPSKLVVYPREGHMPHEPNHVKDLFERASAWFHQYL